MEYIFNSDNLEEQIDKLNLVAIDFEYNNTNEQYVNVLSCSLAFYTHTENFWIPTELDKFKRRFAELKDKYTVVTWQGSAEQTALLSIGITDFNEYRVVDLRDELILLKNDDRKEMLKTNLANVCMMFGIADYGNFKEDTRGLILSRTTSDFSVEEIETIMEYNELDSVNTLNLFKPLVSEFVKVYKKWDIRLAQYRAEYKVCTGNLQVTGFHIRKEKLYNVINNQFKIIEALIKKSSKEAQSLFEEKIDRFTFKKDKFKDLLKKEKLLSTWKLTKTGQPTAGKDTLKEFRHLRVWIEELYTIKRTESVFRNSNPSLLEKYGVKDAEDLLVGITAYARVEKGRLIVDKVAIESLILEFVPYPIYTPTNKVKTDRETLEKYALSKYIDSFAVGIFKGVVSTHKYLTEDKKIKTDKLQSTETMVEGISSTGTLHPYVNPFGSKTGRNQPPARKFPLAQSSWVRSLLKAPKGYKILSMDYGSAELIIGGYISGDEKFLAMATSGDPYISYGIQLGMLPEGATKETHSLERAILKSIRLGLGYGMGRERLGQSAFPLDRQSVATAKAERYVNKDKRIFRKYHSFAKSWARRRHRPTIYGDWGFKYLERATTAYNFPIQATSAMIMREATRRLHRKSFKENPSIKMFALLHDGLYFYVKDDDKFVENEEKIRETMQLSACYIMGVSESERLTVKVDAQSWTNKEIMLEKGNETFENIANTLKWKYHKGENNKLNWGGEDA